MAQTLRACAIGATYYHTPSVRRFAPAIQRMQRTGGYVSKLE